MSFFIQSIDLEVSVDVGDSLHVGILTAESNPNTIIPLLAFITYIV